MELLRSRPRALLEDGWGECPRWDAGADSFTNDLLSLDRARALAVSGPEAIVAGLEGRRLERVPWEKLGELERRGARGAPRAMVGPAPSSALDPASPA